MTKPVAQNNDSNQKIHASQVHTADETPLKKLLENLHVDSSAYTLNQVPDSFHLSRNGPK